MNLVPNVCTECGAGLENKQAWVRSGKLLCSTCDFAHKAPSRTRAQRDRVTHQPRRGVVYKPQAWVQAAMAWVDVQLHCSTPDEALNVAKTKVKVGRIGRIRYMRVDLATNERVPGEEQDYYRPRAGQR